MLIIGDLLEPSAVVSAKYCIVGSGMAGSALAQQLAESSPDVLLIEAGAINSGNEASERNSRIHAEFGGRRFGLPFTRSIGLGGTSNWWHGGWGMLDPIDFESRPWIECSGWPIGHHDLAPFYEDCAAKFGMSASSFNEQELDRRFPQRLTDIEFDSRILRPKMLQIESSPLRWKSTILDLASTGRLRCIFNATALEFKADEDGTRVVELLVGAAQHTVRIRADVFVVCAGALETPRLLLNSRTRIPAGLGNTYGLVGRYLLDHPMGHYSKLRFERPTKAPLYSDIRISDATRLRIGLRMAREYQSRHQIPNHYLWIRPSISPDRIDDDVLLSFLAVKRPRHLSLRQIMALLTNRDILYRVLIYRFGVNATYRYGDLLFMTEQLPNHDSRVELSKSVTDRYSYPVARIEWRLKDADFSGFEKYTTLLFRDALQSEQYTVARRDTLASWVENFRSSAHHLGTTRMADHPRRGVVDRNLQAFGIDNLFVCDGSVFPTSGSVNPVFTILALSRRLGQFLLNGRYSSLVAAWTQGASAGVDTMPTNSPRGSTT